jgi:signal transduction histidine kinase
MPSVRELLELLDGLPASVALWDRDVRLRYGNRRSLVRFGRPYDELLGARLSDLVLAHAVELSAQYIDGALAGKVQQVERAMVDPQGQRYNAHLVTHIPNVVDGALHGYCALAVDITASIADFERARHAREQAALRAERLRIAGDIDEQHVTDELSAAITRLDEAVERATDMLPSLGTVVQTIDRSINELRASVPPRMDIDVEVDVAHVGFPRMSAPFEPASPDVLVLPAHGVPWPPEITGVGWDADDAVALLDLLPAAVSVWDTTFHNVFANAAAVAFYGRTTRSDVVGLHARDVLGAEVFEANLPYVRAALGGQEQHFDRILAHPTGLRHLQTSYLPSALGMISFVVDVTSRVQAELALQDSRAELARGRERERIAHELHNLVIQRLFAAGLAAVRPKASEAQVRFVQDGIVAALADLDGALTTLRENAGLLDLLPDLAHLVHDATQPHGIAATIENVGSVEYVSSAVGAELLAAADIALTNVVEHSGANNVVVTIAADAAGVWLRVADDGRGMSEDAHGKGMADMSARAARLGGTCTWRPNLPAGTLVDWRVPTAS